MTNFESLIGNLEETDLISFVEKTLQFLISSNFHLALNSMVFYGFHLQCMMYWTLIRLQIIALDPNLI